MITVLENIIDDAIYKNASDIHLSSNLPPVFRIDGKLKSFDYDVIDSDQMYLLMNNLLNEKNRDLLNEYGDVDFAVTLRACRLRINIYKYQRKSLAMAIRIINKTIPGLERYNYPEILKEFALSAKGLILVTGAAGTGKSTTLAAMIDFINVNYEKHIITLENPIEYLHVNKLSFINQREIDTDSKNFNVGLRAALREDPDVIMIGELRDAETMSSAITAAETGHLVLATLHTYDAAQTIDRIIDMFPNHQQTQIKNQLSMTLRGVVSQQIFNCKSKVGRVVAYEIMVVNTAISNLIREGKNHQLLPTIKSSSKVGMKSMETAIDELVKAEVI